MLCCVFLIDDLAPYVIAYSTKCVNVGVTGDWCVVSRPPIKYMFYWFQLNRREHFYLECRQIYPERKIRYCWNIRIIKIMTSKTSIIDWNRRPATKICFALWLDLIYSLWEKLCFVHTHCATFTLQHAKYVKRRNTTFDEEILPTSSPEISKQKRKLTSPLAINVEWQRLRKIIVTALPYVWLVQTS